MDSVYGDWQDGRYMLNNSTIDASLIKRVLDALRVGARGGGARAAASRELDACGFLEKYAWPFWMRNGETESKTEELMQCIVHVSVQVDRRERERESLREERDFIIYFSRMVEHRMLSLISW